jgi:hypothetical protein
MTSLTAQTKEEAVQRAMRHLEGRRLEKKSSRDVLGKITRKAPAPPLGEDRVRPKSSEEVLGLKETVSGGSRLVDDPRRSLGIERIMEEHEYEHEYEHEHEHGNEQEEVPAEVDEALQQEAAEELVMAQGES